MSKVHNDGYTGGQPTHCEQQNAGVTCLYQFPCPVHQSSQSKGEELIIKLGDDAPKGESWEVRFDFVERMDRPHVIEEVSKLLSEREQEMRVEESRMCGIRVQGAIAGYETAAQEREIKATRLGFAAGAEAARKEMAHEAISTDTQRERIAYQMGAEAERARILAALPKDETGVEDSGENRVVAALYGFQRGYNAALGKVRSLLSPNQTTE